MTNDDCRMSNERTLIVLMTSYGGAKRVNPKITRHSLFEIFESLPFEN